MRSAVAALVWVALAAPAAALPLRAVHAPGKLGNERLSNERTLTRLARPFRAAVLRARPDRHAKRVGRLHFHTEDGPLEIYLALRSAVRHHRRWVRLRIPARPNGQTGWVPRTALGPFIVRRTRLVVDRTTLTATLSKRGKRIWRSPVGVGAPATPTPGGRFWIRERLRALGGIYGPWAFGTADYSVLSEWPGGGVVGIHGTNQPELIPGRPSHGCIRVPNPAVIRLARLMPVGTPLQIR
jgi:hypothetical protein